VELRFVGKNTIVIENKVINALDEFVLKFVSILKEFTDYVIVSGYIAILFGRSRGTEDIDTIIRPIDFDKFKSFYLKLGQCGYYVINPGNLNDLYEMLEEGLRIRIAIEGTVIPNIELKFVRDDFERFAIENRIMVVLNNEQLHISPMELQIPYKLYLGSDKDIEDAVYLWEIFKDKVDLKLMKNFMDKLGVSGEDYGIEV